MINLNVRAEIVETDLHRARNKFSQRPFGKALFAAFHLITGYQGVVGSTEEDPNLSLRGGVSFHPFAERGYQITLETEGESSKLAITKPGHGLNGESHTVFAVEVNPAGTKTGLSAIDRARILKTDAFEVAILPPTNTHGTPEADLHYRMDILMKSHFEANFEPKTVAQDSRDEVSLAS